jgi:hypothetical protein
LNSPVIHWPAETEVYPPRVIESLDKSSFPLKGSKTFVYTFSSKAIGIHTILPVSLSYFNPVANQYQTIQSSASSFEVSVAGLKKNRPIPPVESTDSIGSGKASLIIPSSFLCVTIGVGCLSYAVYFS